MRERLVKATPQRGTAKAGRHALFSASSFLTIRGGFSGETTSKQRTKKSARLRCLLSPIVIRCRR
jgi:hypothetical protein